MYFCVLSIMISMIAFAIIIAIIIHYHYHHYYYYHYHYYYHCYYCYCYYHYLCFYRISCRIAGPLRRHDAHVRACNITFDTEKMNACAIGKIEEKIFHREDFSNVAFMETIQYVLLFTWTHIVLRLTRYAVMSWHRIQSPMHSIIAKQNF